MIFFIVSALLWICIFIVPIACVWGIWKKSATAFMLSGISAFLLYIWMCVFNYFTHFMIIAPIIFFALSFSVRNNKERNKKIPG